MSLVEKHQKLERNSVILLIATTIAVLIGGVVEIIPLFRTETQIKPVGDIRPYTPLELAGQNIYVREGCHTCHSQQIRSLRDEVVRYGHYSIPAESMYDHPFLWGSKRTGPDLARVGGKYSDDWHVAHLKEPRDLVPESVMPSYSFLMKKGAKIDDLGSHLKALQSLGVPYTDEMVELAQQDAIAQATGEARTDTSGLAERYGEKVNARDFDGQPHIVSEMDALVAYLQVLGTFVDFDAIKDVEDEAP
ncbi:MAG: cytochrome-c oxidase, cbb3-type subunit II [Alphaproteobacteria bacterium]|nr:cytochrome-c oxidase, cbb3-type subunit II [Alphaproteobacteria bacterium]